MRDILLAVTCLVACGSREAALSHISMVRALDDGTVVALWSKNAQGLISLVGGDASIRWSAPLHGTPADEAIVTHKEHVAVRTRQRVQDGLHAQVEMFSLRDGHRSAVSLGTTPGYVAVLPGYVVNDELNEVFVGADRKSVLVTIDMRSGAEVRRVALPFEPTRAVPRASDVVLHGRHADAVVSAAGEVRALEPGQRGCVVADQYWQLTRGETGHPTLTTSDQPSRRITVDMQSDATFLKHCAAYRDRLIVFVEKHTRPGVAGEMLVIERDGTLIGRVNVDQTALPHSVFVTALPRFVPILQRSKGDVDELVMFDLELARTAWRLPMESISNPFQSGNRWYVAGGAAALEITVFDAKTGRLLTAKRVSASTRLETPDANDVGESGLWLHGPEFNATNTLSKLDPLTLAHVAGAPLVVTDISHESRFASISGN